MDFKINKKYRSPNFTKGNNRSIDLIVLHHTGSNNVMSTISWFKSKKSKVSSHYVISRHGTIYQMVDEKDIAWHAGRSRYGGRTKVNKYSIGIELVGDGKTHFTDRQYLVLEDLISQQRHWDVKIVAHSFVAPYRRVDPMPFDWDRLLRL